MKICKECGKECLNNISLGKHVSFHHKPMTSEEYYLKHLGSKCLCPGCGKETNFVNINKGYHPMCSDRSCTQKVVRERLRNDPERYEQFVNKVSENMSYKWEHENWHEKIKKPAIGKRTISDELLYSIKESEYKSICRFLDMDESSWEETL